VIDITFLPALDGLSVYNPVARLRDTLGLAIALEQYAAKFFANGGVPPLALKGPLGSPGAAARAKTDVSAAVKAANRAGDAISGDPRRLRAGPRRLRPREGPARRGAAVRGRADFARVLNLPPVFLQDLTHGTFTNTEQQDLHLTKHTAHGWVRQWEDECNAKLYGPRQTSRFVEMNLDGLMRGDFKSRIEAMARAIRPAQLTPNEARALENRPAGEGGERLYIQGATVPLAKAGETPAAPAPRPTRTPTRPPIWPTRRKRTPSHDP
jgi:phage portal protein BeeE